MADKENNAQETPQNTTDKAQAPKKKPSRPRSPAKKKVAPPKEADVSAVAQDAPSAQGNTKPKQTKQTDATPAPETTAKAADGMRIGFRHGHAHFASSIHPTLLKDGFCIEEKSILVKYRAFDFHVWQVFYHILGGYFTD